MRKVVIAFDRTHFSAGAFNFARQMNEQEAILLVGAFLPEVSIPSVKGFVNTMGDPFFLPMTDEDDSIFMKNVEKFRSLCISNNIDCIIHKEYNDFALPELKKESLFADVIIIGSEAFFEDAGPDEIQESLKNALHASKCPMVVVPEKFNFPSTNVLAYDGSDSSVFAIKQFAYLFPGLTKNKTLLVYSKEEKGYDIPDEEYIVELAGRHFSELSLLRLHQDPEDHLTGWLKDKEDPVLISGAFGRSALSQWFKKSFVYKAICQHRLPVFIAHCKLE